MTDSRRKVCFSFSVKLMTLLYPPESSSRDINDDDEDNNKNDKSSHLFSTYTVLSTL